jgi:hypothetical protein
MEYSLSRPFADDEDYRKILLTKSPEWAYEQEHRLIKPSQEAKLGKRRDGRDWHYLPLPLEALKAVYFGYRIQAKVRDELLASLTSDSAKHIRPYIMRLHPKEYRLVPTAWGPWKPPPPDALTDFNGLWKAIGL